MLPSSCFQLPVNDIIYSTHSSHPETNTQFHHVRFEDLLHLRAALMQKHINLWVRTIEWPLDPLAPHLQYVVLFNLGYEIYWLVN